jgi:16S rRNA (adenine1518-N6/adenine1519-N6)-dimethyltransferase
MKINIATTHRTKYIIDKYGLYAKKNFGQNFIINPSIIENIISLSDITKDDYVIEIGPGIGALTEALVQVAYEVYAFEIDKDLEKVLTNEITASNLYVTIKDFLKVDLNEFISKLDLSRNIVIVSNLPYYITSDILTKLITSDINYKSIIVMLQKEVGDKFINNQGKKDETVLTYLARYYCDCSKLIDVSLTNFIPQPNIESMVIKFNKKEYHLKVKDNKKFLNVTKALLKMRRKTIQNNLNAYLPTKEDVLSILNELNINPLTRPESLSLDDFINITNLICDKYPN